MNRAGARLALAAALALAAGCSSGTGDEQAVRQLAFRSLSTPQAGAVVGPVVLQSGFAIVDFTQVAHGGRVLLRKAGGDWTVLACGGDVLKRRPSVERLGVPDGTAGVLITKLLREEGRLSPDRQAAIAAYRGATLDQGKRACPEPAGR